MKRFALILLFLPLASFAQKPASSSPTVLSVGDVLSNYGIDSAWVNDTAAISAHLAAQPQDYVELTNLCVSIRTKVQHAIRSLENDYTVRDSLIWIDSSTVISDYAIYEFRLRRLADLMGRMSIRYSRLEQQRIEAEKEAARRRAEEEARRQQDERNLTAADLRTAIELHHRSIISACDGNGISDKVKLKNLKDLYYSYLMVYNKYDLSLSNATTESIAKLKELKDFQNNVLQNVIGTNSLPHQIENFKNVLKVRCESNYTDVYRSYTKVFKHTSVPISFSDLREYDEYINRMRTVIAVQQRYLLTIDLRNTIANGTDAIEHLYAKKHRDVLSSYHDVLRSLNQVPAFTTNAESLVFIRNLEAFIAAQQRYVSDFELLEGISRRSDSITTLGNASSQTYDVVSAYREVASSLVPIPSFSSPEGADAYEELLETTRKVQQCYLDIIDLRRTIAHNDDTLSNCRKLDRTLANGYKLLRKQANLRPEFSTLEHGRSYIALLQSHIELQQLCIATMAKIRSIEQGRRQITHKDSPWRHIAKSYSRVEKDCQVVEEITNANDVSRYSRQCDTILGVQQAYLSLLKGEYANDADSRLKHESDVEKIKLIVGIK